MAVKQFENFDCDFKKEPFPRLCRLDKVTGFVSIHVETMWAVWPPKHIDTLLWGLCPCMSGQSGQCGHPNI